MPLRLLTKFLLVLMPLFVFFAGVGLVVQLRYDLRGADEGIATRVGNLGARVAGALSRHHLASNPALAEDLLAMLGGDRAVLCAELDVDTDGGRIAAFPPDLGCRGLAAYETLEIAVDSEPPMTLRVFLSDAEVVQTIAFRRNLTLTILTSAFFVALASASIGFGMIVGGPLIRLRRGLREAADTARWVAVAYPSRDELGDVISSFNDLVMRENVREAALQHTNTELRTSQQALAMVNEELVTQQKRFIAVAAHEFRTPLTIIDGASQRLARYAERIAPEDIRERANRIRNAVARMSELIDTSLNTARLDDGRIEIKSTALDIVALVTRVARRLGDAAPAFEIAVSTRLPTIEIEADARLIEQVFTNLISNAIKYSGRHRRVDIAVAARDERVDVTVRDYGIGIPSEEIPKLFTRFFRASTAKGLPGTGIGLNLVRELVALHGGDVTVESDVGKGSVFTVTLPVAISAARAASHATQAAD